MNFFKTIDIKQFKLWIVIYFVSLLVAIAAIFGLWRYTQYKEENYKQAIEIQEAIDEFNRKQESYRAIYTPEYNDHDGMYLSDALIWVPDQCYGSYEKECVYITNHFYLPYIVNYITEQKYVAIGSDELVH